MTGYVRWPTSETFLPMPQHREHKVRIVPVEIERLAGVEEIRRGGNFMLGSERAVARCEVAGHSKFVQGHD